MARTSAMLGESAAEVPDPTDAPTCATVWYRAVAYRIDLAACRQALGRLPGRTKKARLRHLATAVGVEPIVIERFLRGRLPSAARTVAIVDELGLGPSRLRPWEAGSS